MRRNLSKLGSPVVIAVVLAVAHGFAGGQTAATVDLTGSWRLDPKLHDTLWEGRPLTEKRLYVSYAPPFGVAEAERMSCAVGSWRGWCLSMAPYVTGMGPTDGATAPPEGVNVGYPPAPAFDEFARGFLEEGLRHSRIHPADLRLDPTLPVDVIEAWAMQEKVAGDELSIDSPDVHRAFSQMRHRITDISPILCYATRLDARITDLGRTMAERGDTLLALGEAVAERGDRIASLNGAVVERDKESEGLRQAASEQRNELARLTAELGIANGRIFELLPSTSWRVTDPLRFVKRTFSKCVSVKPVSREPFDEDFYLTHYPDVAKAGIDPYTHSLLSKLRFTQRNSDSIRTLHSPEEAASPTAHGRPVLGRDTTIPGVSEPREIRSTTSTASRGSQETSTGRRPEAPVISRAYPVQEPRFDLNFDSSG